MTILSLQGIGVPPYSARGITETLGLVSGVANLRRTINGELVDLSAPQMRKYKLTLEATDQDTPAIEGIWPGAVVVVDCITELSQEGGTEGTLPETEVDFGRDFVPGSVRSENGFTFYRPRLTMMVSSYSVNKNEFSASVGWTLELEEV